VISGVFVASIVSEPDVVALIGEHEAGSFVFIIDEEGVAGVKKAMLQDDGLESGRDERILFLNSEHSENVSIFGFDKVFFNGVFVVLAVVDEWVFGLRVSGLDLGEESEGDEGQQESDEGRMIVHRCRYNIIKGVNFVLNGLRLWANHICEECLFYDVSIIKRVIQD
jgi:hypothetical protein